MSARAAEAAALAAREAWILSTRGCDLPASTPENRHAPKPRKGRHVTQAIVDRWMRLRAEGFSDRAIAFTTGHAQSSVSKWLGDAPRPPRKLSEDPNAVRSREWWRANRGKGAKR